MRTAQTEPDFHVRIYATAKIPRLHALIRALWTNFPWGTLHVIPGWALASLLEHKRVIDAISTGRPLRARDEMQIHLEHAAAALMQFLENSRPIGKSGQPRATNAGEGDTLGSHPSQQTRSRWSGTT